MILCFCQVFQVLLGPPGAEKLLVSSLPGVILMYFFCPHELFLLSVCLSVCLSIISLPSVNHLHFAQLSLRRAILTTKAEHFWLTNKDEPPNHPLARGHKVGQPVGPHERLLDSALQWLRCLEHRLFRALGVRLGPLWSSCSVMGAPERSCGSWICQQSPGAAAPAWGVCRGWPVGALPERGHST